MSYEDNFTDRLCVEIAGFDGGDASERALFARSVVDTIAVAAAGFAEPVSRLSLGAYPGTKARTWSGTGCESLEAAVAINAIAAHALDYDDVALDSTAHLSAVLVPALFSEDRPVDPADQLTAFGAGLVAARAIALFVGPGHYRKGWHATGTFGVLAATAALARRERLDAVKLRSAFAIAVAQAGGLKLNFGTMAKPVHAGLAAAAAVRAVRLAAAGVVGYPDIFAGPAGFAALYGCGDGAQQLNEDMFMPRPDRIALKLFPCCYATHRFIGVALDVRRDFSGDLEQTVSRAVLEVPAGSLDLIRNDSPSTGLEAKFSAEYALAVALFKGQAGIEEFSEPCVSGEQVRAWLRRVELVEDQAQISGGRPDWGTVTLSLFDHSGALIARQTRSTIPGAPDAPPSPSQVAAKVQDCLDVFEAAFGKPYPALHLLRPLSEVRQWMPSSAGGGAQ